MTKHGDTGQRGDSRPGQAEKDSKISSQYSEGRAISNMNYFWNFPFSIFEPQVAETMDKGGYCTTKLESSVLQK